MKCAYCHKTIQGYYVTFRNWLGKLLFCDEVCEDKYHKLENDYPNIEDCSEL